MKANSRFLSVNSMLNHPKEVITHMPRGIECRFSRNMAIFEESGYARALFKDRHKDGFKHLKMLTKKGKEM